MILNTFNFINIIFSKILKLCLFWRNFFSFLENIFKNFKWLEQLKILVKQFPSKGVVKQFPPKQHNIANRHAQSIAQPSHCQYLSLVWFHFSFSFISWPMRQCLCYCQCLFCPPLLIFFSPWTIGLITLSFSKFNAFLCNFFSKAYALVKYMWISCVIMKYLCEFSHCIGVVNLS